MRHTRATTGDRRSHHALKVKQLVACATCRQPKEPHRLCVNCGSYRGRTLTDPTLRQAKKEKKAKARAA